MRGCSVRAIWILKKTSKLVFSRRFPTVEKQWKQACANVEDPESGPGIPSVSYHPIPFDNQLIQAFVNREQREGAVEGCGIRPSGSQAGNDSWLDDLITRHVISLQLPTGDLQAPPGVLWPIVLYNCGTYHILILPLVDPEDLRAFVSLCWRKDCGDATAVEDRGISDMLLALPCITGSLELARILGEVVTGEVAEPDMYINTASTVGGILDTITGGIGLSSISAGITGIGARAKPVTVPVAAAATAVASAAANATSAIVHGGKGQVKSDNDALRCFISNAMPFGTPLDLNPINYTVIRSNGFSSLDVPHPEQKQPAWKPYLYKGKPRILLTVNEIVNAVLYDQEDVEDIIAASGQVLCRADIEGLPEIILPLSCPGTGQPHAVSYHPCAQAPERGPEKQTVIFSPPLGNFVLARYTSLPLSLKPPLQGFYQLSMVSRDEGAFLMRMKLLDGYKTPLSIDHCSLVIPFPGRQILSMDGTPSYGSVTTSEHVIEWRIVVSGRAHSSKHNDVSFSGSVKFAPMPEYFEMKELNGQAANNFEGAETGDGGANAAKWEAPFCWGAYNYAKASFKILGGTLSGIQIDPKAVTVYPPVSKSVCNYSAQVVSGEYIFWNSLGRCPRAVTEKVKEKERERN